MEAFRVDQTHGILQRPEHQVHRRSDELGWSALYASCQRESAYEASYRPVEDHLIVLHVDGPVAVTRRLGPAQDRCVIPPGGLFILPAGTEFGVKLEGQLESIHIYLRSHLVNEVADELGFGRHLGLRPEIGVQDPLIENLALGIREALFHGKASTRSYTVHLARALAARLLHYHAERQADTVILSGGLSKSRLQLAIDFMHEHLNEPISLMDLSAACHLSPTHFARSFCISTGKPPHRFLMGLRVDRAKRLLRSNMPIAEVALACGFAHQEHLTGVFARQTGITPGRFRNARLERQNIVERSATAAAKDRII